MISFDFYFIRFYLVFPSLFPFRFSPILHNVFIASSVSFRYDCIAYFS